MNRPEPWADMQTQFVKHPILHYRWLVSICVNPLSMDHVCLKSVCLHLAMIFTSIKFPPQMPLMANGQRCADRGREGVSLALPCCTHTPKTATNDFFSALSLLN